MACLSAAVAVTASSAAVSQSFDPGLTAHTTLDHQMANTLVSTPSSLLERMLMAWRAVCSQLFASQPHSCLPTMERAKGSTSQHASMKALVDIVKTFTPTSML